MGAIRPVEIDGVLAAELEDVGGLDGVQFTDQTWEFTLAVTNRSDDRLTGSVEFVAELETTLGLDRDPLRRDRIEIDLAPGKVHREPLTASVLLGGSGMGVVAGLQRPAVVEAAEGETVIEPGEVLHPLASLVVWDRDFYRVNYLWPRRAQYLSVLFALLSVAFAGAIVLLSLG